jgi:tRNA threonylcarbamoyladenosine biosynthesis protein TsaB
LINLFIDTTSGTTVGAFDNSKGWLDYSHDESKGSQVVHTRINQLVEKHNLNWKQLKLITIAGPGSYTGMRLARGLADILGWQEVDCYSFYHFEVPKILGQQGKFICRAFKGEYFVYDTESEESELLTSELIEMKQCFTSFASELDLDVEKILTSELIKENTKQVFDFIIENALRRDIYYFRKENEEFKKPSL